MKYAQREEGPIWLFRVNTFEELRDLVENEIPDIGQYVFRGQSKARWKLEPTLNRLITHARETGVKQGTLDRFVEAHLNRFRLEIRGRRGDNPPKLEDDELWALGQHFGLATPLLDWSQSPYISVFFALATINEDPDDDRVLWCLHQSRVGKINERLAEKQKLHLIVPDSNDNKRLLGQSGLFSKGALVTPERAGELVAFDEALRELEELSKRQSRVVELRYFGGLTVDETATVLKVSPETVMRDWTMAKTWLHRALQPATEA